MRETKATPSDEHLRVAGASLLEMALNDPTCVAALGRLALACPRATGECLMLAILLHWDMCPLEDKTALIGKAAVEDQGALVDNVLFWPWKGGRS